VSDPDSPAPVPGDRSLWIWVGSGFLVLLIAWSVLFTIASRNRVQDVPLKTAPAAKP
jgi:hypothetical protein